MIFKSSFKHKLFYKIVFTKKILTTIYISHGQKRECYFRCYEKILSNNILRKIDSPIVLNKYVSSSKFNYRYFSSAALIEINLKNTLNICIIRIVKLCAQFARSYWYHFALWMTILYLSHIHVYFYLLYK